MPEIEAKNIVKYFKHDKHVLKAIDGINLVANSGEFVCIVGPSGCGKSTFLRILAGLEKPDSGEILVNGKPVDGTGSGRITWSFELLHSLFHAPWRYLIRIIFCEFIQLHHCKISFRYLCALLWRYSRNL